MRYSDGELILIKGTFKDNEELLKTIRKVFYQMSLNTVDLSRLQITFNGKKELQKVMRKMFLPEIDADIPFQQQIDLWMTIKLKDMIVSEAAVHLKSIKVWYDYINQQLKTIENGKYDKKQKMIFNKLIDIKDKTDWDMYANVMARNTIINHVEMCLQQLSFLSEKKDETPEETIERIQQDSNK